MSKIILTNGVVNVEETYQEVLEKERNGDWIELKETNAELRLMQRATNMLMDTRIFININHIQCVKP